MIEFKRRNPANVDNPEAGGDVLFLDSNGVYYTKDAAGNLTVLGNGIAGITKIGTVGLVDTYRITYDSGETFDYTVTNARSIASLTKLNTSGLISTYRVTFNDGTAFDYTVTDGRGIDNIEPPANAGQPNSTDTYTVRYNDGTTSTFIVRNGRDGIDGVVTSVNGKSEPNIVLTAADLGAIAAAEKGASNGVATLDMAGKVPAEQLPAYVDDVLEFANLAAFPATGESGKIYVAIDTGFTYRWSGSQYIIISANQNAFAAITGNTGTATADTVSDTVSITGVAGISTSATDTPDGLVITPAYAAPVSVGTANAEGNADSFARSNHVHAHGDQAGGTLHAAATTSANGFMSSADKTKLDGVQAGAQVNAVTSVHGRTGAVVAQQSDYDAFFTTPSEAAAAAPVQSFNGRTGNITPQQADYDAFFTTPAEAAAAAPVQSVNGQTGNVTIDVPPVALERAFQARTATVTLPTTNAQVALASVTLAAGTWHISAHATFTRTATTAGNFSIMIGPNATPAQAFASATIQHASVANIFVTASCQATVTLAATTTVTLYGAHSAGSASNVVRNLNQQNAPGATAISAIKVA